MKTLIIMLALVFTSLPAFSDSSATIAQSDTVLVPETWTRVICILGQQLNFAGTYSEPGAQTDVCLQNRNTVVDSQHLMGARPFAYSLNFTPHSAGEYLLKIVFSGSYLGPEVYRKITVTCLDELPPGSLKLPAAIDLADVPLTVTINDPTVSHVWYYFGGKQVADSGAPFSAVLPISKCNGGVYPAAFACCMNNDLGDMYMSPATNVTVPYRIQVSDAAATLHTSEDTVPLSVNIDPNLAATSVDYYINSRKFASATSTPYSATADLSALPSGTYDLVATASTADGKVYVSNHEAFSLYNLPDDQRLQDEYEQEMNRETDIAVAQANERAAYDAAHPVTTTWTFGLWF